MAVLPVGNQLAGQNRRGRFRAVVPGFPSEAAFRSARHERYDVLSNREQMARLAKSYKAADDRLEETAIFILDGHDPEFRDRYPAANGGLFSTAQDYGRFCRMLLNQGSLGGRQYLKPETVKLMCTIQTGDLKTGFTDGNGWGLGCCVVRKPQGVTAVLSPARSGTAAPTARRPGSIRSSRWSTC